MRLIGGAVGDAATARRPVPGDHNRTRSLRNGLQLLDADVLTVIIAVFIVLIVVAFEHGMSR